MQAAIAPRRYGNRARTLHWTIVALLTIQYITAILLPHIGRNTPMTTTINLHFSFGILIVLVMAVRLVHRLRNPVPVAPTYNAWERPLARFTHVAFYVLLLIVPFLGWASASAHALPVSLFGVIPLPALAAPRTPWANTAGDIHTWVMWGLLGLVALHVIAALYHYWFRRDQVLQSMLPGVK